MTKQILIALGVTMISCLTHFEIGPQHRMPTHKCESLSPASSASLTRTMSQCISLENARFWASILSTSFSALGAGGGSAIGFTTDRDLKTAEIVTVTLSSIGAAIMGGVASQLGAEFTRDCTQ